MNSRIASLLKDRISEFVYVDKLAGLVREIKYERAGEEVRIPVGADVEDALACDDSALRDMVPDQAYRCIVYFEDRGIQPIKSRTRGISYVSRLRLVCWVNTALLNGDAFAAGKIEQQFALAMNSGTYNFGPFAGVRHTVEGATQRGHGIFSAYTYPDSARQYLLPPYDAFAFEVVTTLRVIRGCEDEVTVGNEDCWTPPTTRRRRNPSEFTCEELLDPITGLTQAQLIDCLNCSGTVMAQIIHKIDEADALSDNTTIISDQQLLVLDDSGRTYIGNGTTPNALVTAKQFLLPVTETAKGINTTVAGLGVGVQLTDPT